MPRLSLINQRLGALSDQWCGEITVYVMVNVDVQTAFQNRIPNHKLGSSTVKRLII